MGRCSAADAGAHPLLPSSGSTRVTSASSTQLDIVAELATSQTGD